MVYVALFLFSGKIPKNNVPKYKRASKASNTSDKQTSLSPGLCHKIAVILFSGVVASFFDAYQGNVYSEFELLLSVRIDQLSLGEGNPQNYKRYRSPAFVNIA